jgi:hypothetical protein
MSKTHTPLTANQRQNFLNERKEIEGCNIVVDIDGVMETLKVEEHIRGSQYRCFSEKLGQIYLSHNKAKDKNFKTAPNPAAWTVWK